ncbi:MAG: hypothetical protein KAU20_07640 [Nanoarchaeota archaeon]|nr:hypothetical protein [Nanoarchaeota archaeon]
MALASILFRKRPSKLILESSLTHQVIKEIELDVTIAETHTYQSLVAQHEIENGSPVCDHIYNQPAVLNLEGFITNSPVKILGGRLGSIIGRTTLQRVETAFTELEELRRLKEPFTVITGLKTYMSMVFQNLVIPVDRRTGDALRFTATFIKIKKVKSEVVELEDLAEDTSDTSAPEVKKDKQTTSPAKTEQTQKARSLLHRILR